MSRQVVYIDDEASICRVFEMILRARGVDIATFTDSNEALAYLDANPVAVVFCDCRMPKNSGYEVLAKMTRPTPFYLVSGDLVVDAKSPPPGVTGFVVKPFRAEDLLVIVEKHLGAT
ncbi:MAG: response regulator [Deltaproteobacteria bacterium]|nr:response regulator [Deltaproteobacteria bacterium]